MAENRWKVCISVFLFVFRCNIGERWFFFCWGKKFVTYVAAAASSIFFNSHSIYLLPTRWPIYSRSQYKECFLLTYPTRSFFNSSLDTTCFPIFIYVLTIQLLLLLLLLPLLLQLVNSTPTSLLHSADAPLNLQNILPYHPQRWYFSPFSTIATLAIFLRNILPIKYDPILLSKCFLAFFFYTYINKL